MTTQPIILIDTREKAPLALRLPFEIATLPVGDYGIKGFSDWDNPAFVLERKSLDDLASSLGGGRERFLREVEKMRAFRFRGLVIESTRDAVEMKHYRSAIAPASILGTLDALAVRAGLHIFWCDDPYRAARCVESLVEKFCKGIEREFFRIAKANANATDQA